MAVAGSCASTAAGDRTTNPSPGPPMPIVDAASQHGRVGPAPTPSPPRAQVELELAKRQGYGDVCGFLSGSLGTPAHECTRLP
jgi:hypothetical protein